MVLEHDVKSGVPRLMMIAIDSMNRSFVERNSNRLPVLSKILGNGTARDLESTADIASASVWPTFVSGKNPGQHGHYFPFQFNPSEMRYRNMTSNGWARSLDFEPFWYEFSRRGVKSIVLDATDLNPLEDIPGIQVVNWSQQSTGRAYSSPPAILSELRRRFGYRPIGAEVPVLKNARHTRRIRDSMIEAVRRKADAMIWLAQTNEWDFFLSGMYEVHRAGHNLWPVEGEFASAAGADDMLDVYVETDNQLGRIIESLDLSNTQLVIFSLNGMNINTAQDHFLGEILRRLNARYLNEDLDVSTEVAKPNIAAFLRSVVPPQIQYSAAKLLGEGIRDKVVNRALLGNLDWTKTPSFPVHSGGEGFIRFNLKGRERDGFFNPDDPEFEKYSNWLKQRILEITVESGRDPLVADIVDVDAKYPGSNCQFLPDLALKWGATESVSTIRSPDIGVIQSTLGTGRGGNHTGESFAAFAGVRTDNDEIGRIAAITDFSAYANYWFRDFVPEKAA